MSATLPVVATVFAITVSTVSARAGNSVFQLIPKAFQRNPTLEMTVYSEFTDAGRKLEAVTRARPAYYALAQGRYHTNITVDGNTPASLGEIEPNLRLALRSRGYEAADARHEPTALITFTWGAHFYPDVPENTLSEQTVLPNIIERAVLVGGDKFARDLGRALVERSNIYAASANPLSTEMARRKLRDSDALALVLTEDAGRLREIMMDNIQFDLGAAAGLAMMNGVTDPVRLFLQRDPRNEALVNQAADDCYFVVVSAYDYRSVAANHRELLWRTRMTVNARSVSQSHALPLLVSNTAPYLATDMASPDVLIRRSMRTPQIDVGTPTPVEGGEP